MDRTPSSLVQVEPADELVSPGMVEHTRTCLLRWVELECTDPRFKYPMGGA